MHGWRLGWESKNDGCGCMCIAVDWFLPAGLGALDRLIYYDIVRTVLYLWLFTGTKSM
jgi:hypothetical protein